MCLRSEKWGEGIFSFCYFEKLLEKVKVCDEKKEGMRLIGAYIYSSR